ncbi:MAG: type II toxin-antitoxin system RnlA family toxin [Clostridiales bacterium]|nr:type II toxin-antitoxin system RnlA family toxin [Clostridiales bacterium]
MGNVRYNISPCTPDEAKRFIDGIDKAKYVPRGTVLADGASFYDRYMYTRDGEHVTLVFDNRGKVLSISAPASYADELLDAFSPSGKLVKKSELPSPVGAQKQDATPDNRQDGAADKPTGEKKSVVRSRVYFNPQQAERTQAQSKVGVRPHGAESASDMPNDLLKNGSGMIVTKKGAFVSTDEICPPDRAKKKSAVMITKNGNEVPTDEIYPPDRAKKKSAVMITKNGIELPTDEIYPPDRAKRKEPRPVDTQEEPTPPPVTYKRTYSYGTGFIEKPYVPKADDTVKPPEKPTDRSVGTVIKAKSVRGTGRAKQTTISFGGDEHDVKPTASHKPHTGTGVFADIAGSQSLDEPQKPRRGRPPKVKSESETNVKESAIASEGGAYSIKNYPPEALNAVIKRVKSLGKYKVTSDGAEFSGTPQEVKNYSITDGQGQKVYLRYATGKHTLSIQGKRSDLFGEIQSQISQDSDYSSALEGYALNNSGTSGKVSEVEKRLLSKLPTATAFLSEQSKIDFSYGILDFSQAKLRVSDYSVLLVPPYRGLERFVFDLQRAEGIKVKMIGQAFDKDENGNYILKTAYQKRIGSVVYAEVMVALYTEYFSRRNFFAHSDNTDGGASRSITDKAVAKKIFDNLLNVVEYNAKKLKEIGFSMKPTID